MSQLNIGSNGVDVTTFAGIPGRGQESGSLARENKAPLSFAQQQVWLHALLAPELPIYNRSLILKHTGPLNQDALEQSLREIVQRHESLRTAFTAEDSIPVQVILEPPSVKIAVTDLSKIEPLKREEEVRRIAAEQMRQPFDLATGLLMGSCLLRLSDHEQILIVTLHTIVADDRSLDILAHELSALYEAYSAGKGSLLPDLPMQYADFATWQRTKFDDQVIGQQIPYWRTRLAGIPTALDLPTDRPRPRAQTFRGSRASVLLPKSLREALEKLSEQQGVSLFVLLLAAFQTLLLRYTRQEDIVVGTVLPGRDEAQSQELIGLFSSVAVVRTDMAGDPSFRELVSRVNQVFAGAFDHQHVPFERLVKAVQPGRDPSRNPIFQVLFSLHDSTSALKPGWEAADLGVDSGSTKLDLELELHTCPDGLEARFTYSTDLFDADTMARMSGHFGKLLEGIVANPDQRISRVDLLTQAERHQLLVEWNDTKTGYPPGCVHQLFEAQARQTPDATAVIFEKERLTYAELDKRANQLANHLMKLGVKPDGLVAICVERSLEMVIGLLGILKAGAAYVPLDPAYPRDRIAFMLEDAEVPVLLTQQPLLENLSPGNAKVVLIDSHWPEISDSSATSPALNLDPENRAYVIYTSGSTGKPKGVEVRQRAVVNFIATMAEEPGLTADDRLLAVTTLSFDIAGLEIYLPLSKGASVEIVSREVAADGHQLLAKLTASRPTVMQATPATWHMLLEAGWTGDRQLKVLVGGEAVPQKLVSQLLERVGSVWNMYGPTETTIWSTTTRLESANAVVTIGRPIANTEIYILDAALQPVPIGVGGELHIGGDGLARGYLKRPELTAEKFIPHPFSSDSGARIYKTGDLVRYLHDGKIEFLGRIDHQVKIRGFRIELGEIEAVLRQHSGIKETVVVAQGENPADKRVVAYIVPRSETPGNAEMRDFLRVKLPEYMIPSVFVSLSAMPLTPNGKVNRRALPVPNQADFARHEQLVAPTDALEAQLVKIWESVLNVQPIGITNNFFELGGHSLLAVKLMRRIEQTFGKSLLIATLLQAPTIEQLAAILRQKGWTPQWCCLVPIQTGGSKPAFFCIHGANGAVVRFHDLARYLGADQNFYGLQAHGLDPAKPCHTRTEDMAAHYIEEIRRVQPSGPYFLGGYSFGGMIAYEMAQQLKAQGQDGTVVVLFDTLCPPPPGSQVPQAAVSHSSVLVDFFRIPAAEKLAYLWRVLTVPHRVIKRMLHVARLPRIVKKVRKACFQAQADYKPQPYSGRVILFRSSHKPLGQVVDPRAGWNTYAAQGLEIYEITGNHENILLEPQVRLVAKQLRTCLDETNGATAKGQVMSLRNLPQLAQAEKASSELMA
jgi:amino acid adenylation domain-containing protein